MTGIAGRGTGNLTVKWEGVGGDNKISRLAFFTLPVPDNVNGEEEEPYIQLCI